MPTKQQENWRYILRNLVLWCILLAGSGLLLQTMRITGRSLLREHHITNQLTRAENMLSAGEPDRAQKIIVYNLERYPQALQPVLTRFGMRLLVMPRVLTSLDPLMKQANKNIAPSVRIRYALITGRYADLPGLVSPLPEKVFQKNPEILLWNARIAWAEGKIPTARENFNRFWKTTSWDRKKVADTLKLQWGLNKPGLTGKQAITLATALMKYGLWEDAFSLIQTCRNDGKTDSLFPFFEGIAAETRGDRMAAIACYRDVLRKNPYHRISLVRLQTLLASEQG